MVELTAKITYLPETDSEGLNKARNERIRNRVKSFENALKSLGAGTIYRRVLLSGTVQANGSLGEHTLTPMENVDENLYIKVSVLYSTIAQ